MRLVLFSTNEDKSYLPYIKQYLAGNDVTILLKEVSTVHEILSICARKQAASAIITSPVALKLLLDFPRKVTLDDYAGSLLHVGDITFLVLNPLEHLIKVPYARHLFERYISKLTKPENWMKATEFKWSVADSCEQLDYVEQHLAAALMIAVDIETVKPNLAITCVSYTGLWRKPNGTFYSHSYVIPCTSEYNLSYIRHYNNLPASKLFQNGQYDNGYFLRYGAPISNWMHDTITLMHCWYAEFPKRLDFIATYAIRDVQFWKDEGKSGNLEDYYRYNARDGWATLNAYLSMVREAPQWALDNYTIEFPLWFPCITCGIDGVLVDEPLRLKLKAEEQAKVDSSLTGIRTMISVPHFNPASPKQCLSLIQFMGFKDVTSSDEKNIKKIQFKHGLYGRVLSSILEYRKAAKAISTYFDAELLNQRLLYELTPWGTDTGRFASKESFFWCGTQWQNLPEYYKKCLVADPGFLWSEIDGEQAESRCTAYESQVQELKDALEGDREFHGTNAERFFGVPYEKIIGPNGEKLDKPLRDLAKRVNHGSTYNMGAFVLLETMGMENVERARRLLKLSLKWSPKEVCEYLILCFDRAYPGIKNRWYQEIIYQVKLARKLVSALGWTRYCFSDPSRSKHALNSYIAHVPQNLSVSIINLGFRRVHRELHDGTSFRLKGQTHDSIIFQYREGREDLVWKAKELMENPVTVKGQTLLIPMAVKCGDKIFGKIKERRQA